MKFETDKNRIFYRSEKKSRNYFFEFFFIFSFSGINDKERSHYENIIGGLKKELQASRTESPRKQEKIRRRNRLKEGVRLLKLDLARAQHLVNEANSLCQRLQRPVHFSVTLRIPPSRLGPSTESGSLRSKDVKI